MKTFKLFCSSMLFLFLVSFTSQAQNQYKKGTIFKTVKYVDLTKKGIGMLPKSLCLEQISNDKIDSYKLYSKTTGKMSYELSNVIMDSKM